MFLEYIHDDLTLSGGYNLYGDQITTFHPLPLALERSGDTIASALPTDCSDPQERIAYRIYARKFIQSAVSGVVHLTTEN
jgi:hypothetical protein